CGGAACRCGGGDGFASCGGFAGCCGFPVKLRADSIKFRDTRGPEFCCRYTSVGTTFCTYESSSISSTCALGCGRFGSAGDCAAGGWLGRAAPAGGLGRGALSADATSVAFSFAAGEGLSRSRKLRATSSRKRRFPRKFLGSDSDGSSSLIDG